MIQPIIEKSYLVELNVGTVSAQKQIPFQYIPILEGATIYAIQTFSSTQLGVSPNGSTVASAAGLSELTVTFAVEDRQDIYQLPCTDLNSPLISGFQRMFNNKKLNLTKSFITINSIVSIANNNAVLFNFIYR